MKVVWVLICTGYGQPQALLSMLLSNRWRLSSSHMVRVHSLLAVKISLTSRSTGGHACFFTFIAEMKQPKDFPKALGLLQIVSVVVYAVTAAVMYRYGGMGIKSPALGSAGPVISRITYGLAIPTVWLSLLPNSLLTILVDNYCWCHFWSRRCEVCICPHVCYKNTSSNDLVDLDVDCWCTLDLGLDNCREVSNNLFMSFLLY